LRATPRLRAPLSLVFGALIASGVQAAELPEVTVSAPSLKTFGRDATGAQIQQATASARIRYNPIMLTTNSGRALLNDKVAEVARGLCRKLDIVTVVGTEDESTCVQRAVTGAKVQIAVAISRQKVS
jgi:UrcA family protein